MVMPGKGRMGIAQILKRARLESVGGPMTLMELATKSGVSVSHLGRIERGERFPSARILRKIAKPLGFDEKELFIIAGFLPPESGEARDERYVAGQLDPVAAAVLSREPPEIQRTLVALLTLVKNVAYLLYLKNQKT